MDILQKVLPFIKSHKYKSIAIAIVVIITIFIVSRSGSSSKFETATAVIGNVKEIVSVTGSVSPVDKADLSFEKGGVITQIYVSVGDNVKIGDRIASLDSAGDTASYQSALATLADMTRGLRPEEQTVEQSKVDAATQNAMNAVQDAYVQAQGALVNNTDSLFNNPGSPNSTLIIPADSYMTRNRIQDERVRVAQALSNWAIDLAAKYDAVTLLSKSLDYLAVFKSFMNDLSNVVGRLTVGNSGLDQATINSYTIAVNTALAAVNNATDSITTATSNLNQANYNYSLKVAGNSSDAIKAQQAKVDQAAAELAKDTILSPINGIVTKITPQVGEFVALGQPQFSVQTVGNYKIEANVPEADIAKVAVGDYSSTTLDAYNSETYFGAKVVKIDPAETVIEGVPTYKVTLYFTEKDQRIRSGMTANLEILTNERNSVVTIPYRAVMDDNGTKIVRIMKNSTFSTTTVKTGLKGYNGMIEIVSGLKPGDKVVTYVK